METDSEASRPKKRRMTNHSARFDGEIDRFRATLKESEAQIRIEKKFAFEERKLKAEMEFCEADRQERRAEVEAERHQRAKEGESRTRIKIEKFKLMRKS